MSKEKERSITKNYLLKIYSSLKNLSLDYEKVLKFQKQQLQELNRENGKKEEELKKELEKNFNEKIDNEFKEEKEQIKKKYSYYIETLDKLKASLNKLTNTVDKIIENRLVGDTPEEIRKLENENLVISSKFPEILDLANSKDFVKNMADFRSKYYINKQQCEKIKTAINKFISMKKSAKVFKNKLLSSDVLDIFTSFERLKKQIEESPFKSFCGNSMYVEVHRIQEIAEKYCFNYKKYEENERRELEECKKYIEQRRRLEIYNYINEKNVLEKEVLKVNITKKDIINKLNKASLEELKKLLSSEGFKKNTERSNFKTKFSWRPPICNTSQKEFEYMYNSLISLIRD